MLSATQAEQDKKNSVKKEIDTHAISILEAQYVRNRKPTLNQMVSIATALDLDKDVVRKWFRERLMYDTKKLGNNTCNKVATAAATEVQKTNLPVAKSAAVTSPEIDPIAAITKMEQNLMFETCHLPGLSSLFHGIPQVANPNLSHGNLSSSGNVSDASGNFSLSPNIFTENFNL